MFWDCAIKYKLLITSKCLRRISQANEWFKFGCYGSGFKNVDLHQTSLSTSPLPFDFLPDYVMALNPVFWEHMFMHTAYLISPPVTMKRGLCMRFTYWAAGVALNGLSVYLQDPQTKILRLAFSTMPRKQWTWEEVRLVLPHRYTYNVCKEYLTVALLSHHGYWMWLMGNIDISLIVHIFFIQAPRNIW